MKAAFLLLVIQGIGSNDGDAIMVNVSSLIIIFFSLSHFFPVAGSPAFTEVRCLYRIHFLAWAFILCVCEGIRDFNKSKKGTSQCIKRKCICQFVNVQDLNYRHH